MSAERRADLRRAATTETARPSPRPRGGGATAHEIGWRDRLGAALDHHRASARDAGQRLLRQWGTGLMTMLVIAVALSLPATLYVVLDNLRAIAGPVADQAQVSLFLRPEVEGRAQRVLAERLRGRDDIASVEVITREQALAEFRAQSGYGDVLDSLPENPLPGVLLVLPARVADAPALREALAAEPGVEIAQLDTAWLEKLAALLAIGERLAEALALAFGVAVLLVVVNTLRLAIESRREEILVVKLIGGTDAFVRRPFLYTGLWIGLAGGLVAALLVALLVAWIASPVATLGSLYGSTFALRGLGVEGALALVSVGGTLGLAGAWVAVARHLRLIEPV